LCASPVFALSVPPAADRVVDLASILKPEEAQRLSASLALFQQETGPQIQVLIIPSLDGESLEGYSIRVADQWGPGSKKKSDGVLLLMSIGDRKVRIEVGQGLEGTLPDILAGRIIRDTMVPYFKAERYRDGLIAGLQAIATRLGGTLKNVPILDSQEAVGRREPSSGFHYSFLLFLLVFLVLPKIFGRRSSPVGGFGTGMLLGGLLGGGRRSGGFFGGGSGGGFGGFGGGGGGGFSGGGASGDW
jgi:uncharacterized protein